MDYRPQRPMMLWIQHPPLRITAVFALIVMGVSMYNLETLIFLLFYGLLLLIVCRVPFSLLKRRLLLSLPFIVFSIVFFTLYDKGLPVAVGSGWLSISLAGLHKALLYSTRLLFTLEVLTLLFHRMTMPQFFQALVILKIPGIFVELILFTLRFIDVIRGEALRMVQALRSRGMKQRALFSLKSYTILAQLLGNLLLRSLQRSERIYMGMMSRGYRGVPPQLDLEPARTADWVYSALWIAPVLALFIYGIGR
jgi:cobalt/nickel transport system permease protein